MYTPTITGLYPATHKLLQRSIAAVCLIMLLMANRSHAEVYDWTWEAGTATRNFVGIYGVQDVQSSSTTPGARRGSISWHTPQGEIYLFGGYGYGATSQGLLNDLWRYDPTSSNWTWISGSSSLNQYGKYGTRGISDPANVPGAREDAVSWTDAQGNLWLFGGDGRGSQTSGYLNDLWKFDPNTREWTWVAGSDKPYQTGTYETLGVPSPTANPGGRRKAAAGFDSARQALWLFGGYGYAASSSSGRLSDVWKYDLTSGMWAWVKGSSGVNQAATYGTMGVGNQLNTPSGRSDSAAWMDGASNLWLFGGEASGKLNDLWKLNTQTMAWTWVNGSKLTQQTGRYGQLRVASTANSPGGRSGSSTWTDEDGHLWMFGGDGYGEQTNYSSFLNDLWVYSPTNNTWAWVKGSKSNNQIGTYGERRIAAEANVPGSRTGATAWAAAGAFYLFGGTGLDGGSSSSGYLNDVWKFNPTEMEPNLLLYPSSFTRSLTQDHNLTPDTFSVWNSGTTGTVNYTVTDDAEWLFVDPEGGSTSNTSVVHEIYYSTEHLQPGDYDAIISLVTSGNSEIVTTVGIQISVSSPTLIRSPSYMNIPVTAGDDAPKQTFEAWHTGKDTELPYSISATVPWLSVNLTTAIATGEKQSHSITFDTSELAPGIHLGSLVFSCPEAANSLSTMSIYLNIGSTKTGSWAWMGGSKSVDELGTYGTKGIPDINNMPGGRRSPVTWTDSEGNLWLFGGKTTRFGSGNLRNDLWKYMPGQGTWTWISGSDIVDEWGWYGTEGVPSTANRPGARWGAASWTDSQGNFWLFGGVGYGLTTYGILNDLWVFKPADLTWTWISGDEEPGGEGTYGEKGVEHSNNTPGARFGAAAWADSTGKLWLFGGDAELPRFSFPSVFDGILLNDLWVFDPSSGNWTWVSGDITPDSIAVYGQEGQFSPLSNPGGRRDSPVWIDKQNNLWLFGGTGWRIAGLINEAKSDIWVFNTERMEWQWAGGARSSNAFGAAGILGVAAEGNFPGTPNNWNSWIDRKGNFWFFNSSGSSTGMWKHDLITSTWAFMKSALPALYGDLGEVNGGSSPGRRAGAATWTDADGNLWLFGGFGISPSPYGMLNDLWKFNIKDLSPSLSQIPSAISRSIAAGDEASQNIISTWNSNSTASLSYSVSTNAPWISVPSVTNMTNNVLEENLITYNTSNLPVGTHTGNVVFSCPEALNPVSTVTVTMNVSSNETGVWSWQGGGGQSGAFGVYGIKGSPDESNMPGAREGASTWVDRSGVLWLFGGVDYEYGWFNDLWRFDPETQYWTWMNGSNLQTQGGVYGTAGQPAVENTPSAREDAVTWVDLEGDLWLYGGRGYYEASTGRSWGSNFGDLWKYDTTSGTWAWMKGEKQPGKRGTWGILGVPDAANVPYPRSDAISWTDATGSLWLFGGYVSYDDENNKRIYGRLNDLWKYDVSNNQWTWMKGSSEIDPLGVYGSLGISSPSNTPGGRSNSVAWTDSAGNLWLFGGFGKNAQNTYGSFSDLWKYEPGTNTWTWVKGPNETGVAGVYGIQGQDGLENNPGARSEGVSWTDSDGFLWLFGGTNFNDLWRYNTSTGNWTWMKGSSLPNQSGEYGIVGIPAAGNTPAVRNNSAAWRDASGHLWLFGGRSVHRGYGNRVFNDLWRFSYPATSGIPWEQTICY